jgi:hypothetical protein
MLAAVIRSHIVQVVEGVGAGIMTLGALGAFTSRALHAETAQRSYEALRRNLGWCICSASRS